MTTTIIVAVVFLSISRPVIFKVDSVKLDKKANANTLKKYVKYLSNDLYPRNLSNRKNYRLASAFIEKKFRENGCKIQIQEYLVGKDVHRNVICIEEGSSNKVIVVGAHYDSFYQTPGADDNASGVAGIIELSRLLRNSNLGKSVYLVAYDTEEPPYFNTTAMGSYKHAQLMSEKGEDVVLMISLEMIGYFTEEGGIQKYPHFLMKLIYPSKGDFIAIVDQFASNYGYKLKKLMLESMHDKVMSLNLPTKFPGVSYSDHMNYWKFGYSAVMVTDTAFYRNEYYHDTRDTFERLDYKRMARVVNGVYLAIIDICN